jgi:hypothetical protein
MGAAGSLLKREELLKKLSRNALRFYADLTKE